MLEGQDAGHHIHRAGARAQVAEIAFRGGDGHVAQDFANGRGLALVVEDGANAMGDNATDVGRSDAGVAERSPDGLADGYALQSLCRWRPVRMPRRSRELEPAGRRPGLGHAP